MEFDFRQLTALIVAVYGNRANFAADLGVSKSTLSNKLNNKTAFDPEEIIKSCELLSIAPQHIGVYFFTPKVHNCERDESESTERLAKRRLQIIWNNMKQRCLNPDNPMFKDYGARGITVCQEWVDSFQSFYEWALNNGYRPYAKRGDYTLDRIDNNGNYCPENCRWADMKVQSNNRRPRSKKNK